MYENTCPIARQQQVIRMYIAFSERLCIYIRQSINVVEVVFEICMDDGEYV